MTEIKYLKGDATSPQAKGPKIICHVCNDRGRWGKGFVVALSARWPSPEQAYREWFRSGDGFGLGAVQVVQVGPNTWVANMVGQHGMRGGSRTPPIRYGAIEQALAKVADKAKELGASVDMPRIGCGLAGGKWDLVEPLIVKRMCEAGVPVTVYDL
jgi:O-acetyl-ADP-ribose deacetylase (regulator of RNase III)